MAELEKLGTKYRIALRIARDERWERLQCSHKGVYADDCLVDRVQKRKASIILPHPKVWKYRTQSRIPPSDAPLVFSDTHWRSCS